MSDRPAEVVALPTICPVCGKEPNGRSLSDAKRLLELLSMKTKVNWQLCRKDKKLNKEGFVALVEAEQPEQKAGSLIPPGDAVRTGRVVHVKREVAEALFGQAIDPKWPMAFCQPGVIEKLNAMIRKSVQ